MKKNIPILLILTAFFLSEMGFAQRHLPFTASGTWEREGHVDRIYLFQVVSGKLERVSVALLNDDKTFDIAYVPPTEGFYVIGIGDPASRENKYTFYFKPGDRLNFVVNDTSYTLVGENTRENMAMAAWNDFSQPFRMIRTGNRIFDELFAKYRKFYLMEAGVSSMEWVDLTANTDILMYPYGIHLLLHHFMKKMDENSSLYHSLNTIKNDTLKGEVFLFYFSQINNLSDMQKIIAEYAKFIITEDQKTRFNREIERIHKLHIAQGVGVSGLDFTFNDVNGNPVSFSDFKGKVVYVDVWATWCAPCRAEIPHLRRVKEHFKDNTNIVFIGISTDHPRDIQKWKDFVAAEQLGGVQLHGNIDGSGNISRLYQIVGIPRFLLFDRQGNIVSLDAPRPSSPELIPMLTRLLR